LKGVQYLIISDRRLLNIVLRSIFLRGFGVLGFWGSGVWGEIPMSAHAGMDKENAKKMVKYILTLKK
jgi:hypothetical protein